MIPQIFNIPTDDTDTIKMYADKFKQALSDRWDEVFLSHVSDEVLLNLNRMVRKEKEMYEKRAIKKIKKTRIP